MPLHFSTCGTEAALHPVGAFVNSRLQSPLWLDSLALKSANFGLTPPEQEGDSLRFLGHCGLLLHLHWRNSSPL